MEIQRYMPEAQSMIFSATVPKYIQEIAKNYMREPLMIDMVGEGATQIPDTISHEVVLCNNENDRLENIKKFVCQNRDLKIIIFCRTKADVRQYERETYARFGCLHGDLM